MERIVMAGQGSVCYFLPQEPLYDCSMQITVKQKKLNLITAARRARNWHWTSTGSGLDILQNIDIVSSNRIGYEYHRYG